MFKNFFGKKLEGSKKSIEENAGGQENSEGRGVASWEIVAAGTDGANLVDGKPTFEYADTHKHDLDKMVACCEAEVLTFMKTGHCPGPFYFKRVAIICRKEKQYLQEFLFCKMYLRMADLYAEIMEARGRTFADVRKGPSAENMKDRADKAMALYQKECAAEDKPLAWLNDLVLDAKKKKDE